MSLPRVPATSALPGVNIHCPEPVRGNVMATSTGAAWVTGAASAGGGGTEVASPMAMTTGPAAGAAAGCCPQAVRAAATATASAAAAAARLAVLGMGPPGCAAFTGEYGPAPRKVAVTPDG